MKKFNTATLLLIGGISLFSLSGCEQAEQAANDAFEKAKQSAAQVLEEATQNGSIGNVKQSANQVLDDARQKASGLLGQASELLQKDQGRQNSERPADSDTAEDGSTNAL